jgi:MOSC domain-containing protein YiiM
MERAEPRLHSVNVGQPRPLAHRRGVGRSAIFKEPVDGPRWLGELGLEGDTQVDRRFHGGPSKAVCVYPLEHLRDWHDRLGELGPGAFGENFTTVGIDEASVRLGDVYAVGAALVQVTNPRVPCFKLAARHGSTRLPSWIRANGWTGFYLRVLRPGAVQAGDALALVERDPAAPTVREAFLG